MRVVCVKRQIGALAVLPFALGGLCAGPASAGDVRCVIAAMTPANQLILRQVIDTGVADPVKATLEDSKDAFAKCAKTDDQIRMAAVATAGYVLENVAIGQLRRSNGIEPARLEQAWMAIPAEDRAFLTADPTKLSSEARQQFIVLRAMFSLPLPSTLDKGFDSPAAQAAVSYFYARGMRVGAEKQF